ncbi:MAG: phosphatase PAP2 family protein [Prevotella sp.]|nr:phosphatase PAP2 family protein [Prevotella sp.]
MYRKLILILLTNILCVNLHAQDVPQVTLFLPNPPTAESDLFICDNILYTEGKSLRTTERGVQAKGDMVWDLDDFLPHFADIMGISVSAIKSSNIYALLDYGDRYGQLAIKAAIQSYNRERPYVYFNESSLLPELEEQYRYDSSYPAFQSCLGWLYALLLAEVCPDLMNTILQRGVDFGPSVVISGFGFDSDAYAGYLLGSAILSRLHTHSGFDGLLTYAQADYKRLKASTRASDDPYFTYEELPNSVIYLPDPPAANSAKNAYDLEKYQEGKSLRRTRSGIRAIEDVEYSADNFCRIYSEVLGVTINASATPAIYELVQRVHPLGNAATQMAKGHYMRKRPYVEMNEPTSYAPDEDGLRETGSYPSGHASGSWLMALVFSEVARTSQDALLARAYTFGQGRVITGYHWQTDVDYGRLVGSAVYAMLHTDKDFVSQMAKAVREYKEKYTAISTAKLAEEAADAPVYNLQGVRLQRAPARRGIYIKGNKKIAY